MIAQQILEKCRPAFLEDALCAYFSGRASLWVKDARALNHGSLRQGMTARSERGRRWLTTSRPLGVRRSMELWAAVAGLGYQGFLACADASECTNSHILALIDRSKHVTNMQWVDTKHICYKRLQFIEPGSPGTLGMQAWPNAIYESHVWD